MHRSLFAVPVFLLTSMSLGAQDGPPLLSEPWKHTFSSDIKHYEVTALGTVLVSTEEETAVLDPGTGKVVWSSSVLRDCELKGGERGRRRIRDAVWCRWGDKNWFRLSTFSSLPIILAAGETDIGMGGDGLVVLDIESGNVIWDSSELEVSIERVYWSVRPAEAAVLGWGEDEDKDRSLIVKIDLQSAGLRWKTELPMKKDLSLLGTEDFLVITGENRAGRDIMARIDSDKGALLYANELPLKGDWELVRSSNPAMLMGKSRAGDDVVIGIDIEKGEVLYSSTLLAKELEDDDYKRLVSDFTFAFDPSIDIASEFGDTLEIFSDGDKRVLGVDPWTGAILWNPERSQKLKAWTYRAGLLLVKDDKHVTAYRTKDGAQLWQRESDAPHSLWTTDTGVLAGCGLFDGCGKEPEFYGLENGKSIWGDKVRLGKETVGFIIIKDALFAVSDDNVYRVELSTGSYEELLEFDFHGEMPTYLREQNGGFLLLSDQNTLFVDAQGEFQYHKYYKAPGMSFLEKTGRMALAVGIDFAMPGYSNLGEGLGEGLVRQIYYGHHYPPYNPISDIFYPNLSRRFTATSELVNFRYIYTEGTHISGREGFSLVRINLDDGAETGRVWVGQRKPDFELDPIDQIVYVKRDGRTIEALAFEGAN